MMASSAKGLDESFDSLRSLKMMVSEGEHGAPPSSQRDPVVHDDATPCYPLDQAPLASCQTTPARSGRATSRPSCGR